MWCDGVHAILVVTDTIQCLSFKRYPQFTATGYQQFCLWRATLRFSLTVIIWQCGHAGTVTSKMPIRSYIDLPFSLLDHDSNAHTCVCERNNSISVMFMYFRSERNLAKLSEAQRTLMTIFIRDRGSKKLDWFYCLSA